jgi:hypothetical protein
VSYNIDTWKTVELNDLSIPLASFNKELVKWSEPPKVQITLGGDAGIAGNVSVDNTQINVEQVNIRDVGSGWDFHNYLLPALKKSSGTLVAFLVWEGGDSMSVLTVKDGNVQHEDFDPVATLKELLNLRERAKRETP